MPPIAALDENQAEKLNGNANPQNQNPTSPQTENPTDSLLELERQERDERLKEFLEDLDRSLDRTFALRREILRGEQSQIGGES